MGYIYQGGRGGSLGSIVPNYRQAASNPWGLADIGTDNNVTIGGQQYSLRQDTQGDGSYILSDTSNNDNGGYRYDANGNFQNWVPYNNLGNNDWVVPLASALTMGAYGAVGAGAGAASDGAAVGGGYGAVGGGAEGYAGLDAASTASMGGGASVGGGATIGQMGAGAAGAAGAAGGAGGAGGAAGAGGAGGAGGADGASSSGFPSLGSGPGGAMTAADYAKYGTAIGGMLGGAAGSKPAGGGNQYVPTGLGAADNYWQQGAAGSMGAAQRGGSADPGFATSYARTNGLDWNPYLQRAGQAGAAYGQVGDAAMGQMSTYGQRAAGAMGAEDQMYGAAGHVLDTAFDPQDALYARTAQRTQDQIRAGQAARGLGNSETGMMEEAGAMGNFNIDWQNAQLARQATGIQAAGGAVGAGVGAGRMAGADMSAGLGAGAAGAGYYGQAGSVPFGAQQQWAAAPGQASGAYIAGQGSEQQLWGNAQSGTIPYMNAGNGAIQQNYQNTYQQNRDMVAGMSQVGGAVAPSVAGWFAGGGGGGSNWTPAGGGGADWATGTGSYAQYAPTDYGSYI